MARTIGIDREGTETQPNWWERDDILMRISKLDHREGQIEQRLEELVPAQNAERNELRREQVHIRRLIRLWEKEGTAASRNN